MSTIKVVQRPSNIASGNTALTGSTNGSNQSSGNGGSAGSGNGYTFPAPPQSPIKDALKPNAHPYAIKTTSTALLSRSNSSPQHLATVQHRYIPQTPPSPKKEKSEKQNYGGRHRYSRSLTNTDLPRPLPVPLGHPSSSPTHGDFAPDDFAVGIQYTGGAGTLSSSTSSPMPIVSVPPELGLPDDPKSWTPSNLAAFLATPFGLRGLRDAQEAKSAADFVESKKISGRAFLRLNEDDLERHALPPTWRLALLSSSRDLRQSQLQKRIWGSSSSSTSYTNASYVHPSRTRTRSDSMSSDMSDVSAHSSVSASSSRSGTRDRGRGENGRVKGMVQNFERSSSVDEGVEGGLEGHRYSRSLSPSKRTSVSSNSGSGALRSRPGSAIFPSQTGGSFPKGDYIPERRGSQSPEGMPNGHGNESAPWLLSPSSLTGSPKKEPRPLPYPPLPPVLSPTNTGNVYGTFTPQVTGFEGGFTPQATGAGSFTPQATGGVFIAPLPIGPFTPQTFVPPVHSYDYALASVHPSSGQGDFGFSGSLANPSALEHRYTGIEGRPLPYPPHEAQFYEPHVTGNSSAPLDLQTDAEGSVASYETARDTETETVGYDTAHESSFPTVLQPKREEELTIEELLASEPGTSTGAGAWELELGDTVKKISTSGRVTGRTGRRGKGMRSGVGVEGLFAKEEHKTNDSEREISEGEILASVLGVPAHENDARTPAIERSEPFANEKPAISEEELARRRQEAYEVEQERKKERERLLAIEQEREQKLERERLAREEQEKAEAEARGVEGENMQREVAEQGVLTDTTVEVLAMDNVPKATAPSIEYDRHARESSEREHQLQELESQESQLRAEVNDTRRIAEELKSRIEAVEKKIEAMEEREHEHTQPVEPPTLSSFLVGVVRKTLRTVVVPILGERTPGIVADFVGQPRNGPAPAPQRQRRRDVIVSSGGYLVLFSIGMCAVVLRVLLKRAATLGGKRLGSR